MSSDIGVKASDARSRPMIRSTLARLRAEVDDACDIAIFHRGTQRRCVREIQVLELESAAERIP